MSIDRQVQVELVLKAADALRSAESLYTVLEKISKLPMGEINKALSQMKDITKDLAPASKEAAASMGQLTQQVKNFEHANVKVAALRDEMKKLSTVTTQSGEESKKAASLFEYFAMKAKSHLAWMATGLMLSGIIAAPAMFVAALAEIEKGMAGMQQVNKGLHEDQALLNQETKKFIDIAAVYGEKVEEIIRAGQSWGRMYKDLGIVNALTQQSVVLAVADNFSLLEANKALEAAMFQYGLTANNMTEAIAYSGRIIDVWTKLAHQGGTTAQDLAKATERTGAVARQTGIDFEFLSAMVATATRATQLSGENIGNMIKSVLGSIHSDKATKEIEALGVATRTVGKDGVIELRKAQDVLLDISIAADGTNKNLEETYKAISGGKFQWSKTAAMLGDYKEFIRTWGEAVNSTGFAAEQVTMQLDTISRKLKSLVADVQGLVVNGGNAGLAQYIKEQVAGIDNFVVALQKVPASGWQAISVIGQLAVALYIAERAWASYRIMVEAADAAQTSMARKNLIVLALTVLGAILYQVVEHFGALENAQRSAMQKAEDDITVRTQQLEQYQKQAEFMDTLILAHGKLNDQLNKTNLTDEKRVKLTEDRAATEKELTLVLGAAAVERIRQNNWSEESIDREKKAFKGAIDEKKIALAQMRSELAADLDNKVEWLRGCVDAYYQEVDAFKDSIGKKINLLGVWKAAQLTAQEWMTKAAEVRRQRAQEGMDYHPEGSKEWNYYKGVKAEAENDILYHQNKGAGIVKEGAAEWEQKLAEAQKARLGISTPNYRPTGSGGSEVTEKPPKGSSSLPPNAATIAESQKRNEDRERMDKLYKQLKIDADAYAQALEQVSTQESIYGQSAGSLNEKLSAQRNRVKELGKEEMDVLGAREALKAEQDEAEARRDELAEKVKAMYPEWESMSKTERALARQNNAEYAQSLKTVHSLVMLIQQADLEMAKLAKDRFNVQGTVEKAEKGDQSLETRFKDSMDRNKASERDELSKIPNWSLFGKTQGDSTQLFYAINRQKLIKDQIAIIRAQLDEASKPGPNGEVNGAAIQKYTHELDALEKQAVEARVEVTNLKAKLDVVKEGVADMVIDAAINGRKFSDIWKKVWNDFATDALKAILKVSNTSPGLLSQIFGLFGGSGAKATGGVNMSVGAGGTAVFTAAHKGEDITGYPKMHSGGDVMGSAIVPHLENTEVIRTLQVGEEVNSNKDRRSNEILGAVAMKAMNQSTEKPNNIFIQAMDSKSFAEFMDTHGELLVAILRKQGAMGNRM